MHVQRFLLYFHVITNGLKDVYIFCVYCINLLNDSLKFCLFTFLNKTSNVESQISKYFVDQLKTNKNVTAKIQLDM
jgi:hypothetical protein